MCWSSPPAPNVDESGREYDNQTVRAYFTDLVKLYLTDLVKYAAPARSDAYLVYMRDVPAIAFKRSPRADRSGVNRNPSETIGPHNAR